MMLPKPLPMQVNQVNTSVLSYPLQKKYASRFPLLFFQLPHTCHLSKEQKHQAHSCRLQKIYWDLKPIPVLHSILSGDITHFDFVTHHFLKNRNIHVFLMVSYTWDNHLFLPIFSTIVHDKGSCQENRMSLYFLPSPIVWFPHFGRLPANGKGQPPLYHGS